MLNRLAADLASAWKGVLGGRLASAVAILALALGIGASVTAAAVAYGGLLKPLPFPHSDHLFSLEKFFVPTNLPSGLKLSEFGQWRERLAGVLAVTGYAHEQSTLRGESQPRAVSTAYVVDNWFSVFQARAEFGRLIDGNSPLDDAVVSRAFADRESPGNPAGVLGRTFTIGTRPFRVAGVLPASFSVVSDAEVWAPARGASALTIIGPADSRYYQMIARLEPGHSAESGRAAASAVLASVETSSQKNGWRLNMKPLRSALLGDSRPVLLAFLVASALVLLVACANVAMLLVNRAVARSREFAVRIALGASRGRLLTVATLETTILASAGAAGGWAIARGATSFLQRQTGLALPAVATLPSGGAVTIGAVMAAVFVVAACAATPLVVLRRSGLATSLRSITTTSSRGNRRVRGALVVAQLAMTVVLLTGAGLLGRTLLAVSRSEIGIDKPDQVVTMAIPIRESTADPAAAQGLVQRVLDETRRLPGVTAAGVGGALPPTDAGLVFTIRVSNTEGSVDSTRAFDMVPATDGYFEALGARLVTGRFFEPADMLSPDPICVMSESALKHLALVTDTAVGRVLNLNTPTAAGPRVKPRIVGVVRDIRYSGLDAAAHGGIYILWRQLPRGSAFLIARTAGDPQALASAVTRIVREADPSVPAGSASTLPAVVDRALAPRSARFSLVGVFAVSAALLGVVGLSGALIRSVVERQRELAIRSAVGATPRRLLADVVRHGAMLTLAGVALGIGASALLARAVSTILYGVTPHDPLTYAATSASVVVIAVAACLVPARRAASADPVILLRSE
jgi:predicted permease